ncbi:hypothetical protein FDZ64_04015 [Ehrlichia ruminantium]|nr:hypothetical protein FDZ64_04015 [Ehrlichia ruminantium]
MVCIMHSDYYTLTIIGSVGLALIILLLCVSQLIKYMIAFYDVAVRPTGPYHDRYLKLKERVCGLPSLGVAGQKSDKEKQENVLAGRSCKAILGIPDQEQESKEQQDTQFGGVEEAPYPLLNRVIIINDLVNIEQKDAVCGKT